MYSKEEIERKRLQALALKQEKISKNGNPPVPEPKKNIHYNKNNLANTSTNSGKNFGWNKSTPGIFKQKQIQNRYNPVKTVKTNEFYGNSKATISANFIMIQNNRFSVELSKFHVPIIEVFKTISSRAYDSQSRTWNFHLKEYDLVFEKLMERSDCTITGLPKFTKQTFDKLLNQKEEKIVDLSSIDETLRESLMPFQQDGIRFGISKNGRCMIADDMGLGKTIQALGIADYFRHHWPMLIVTPSSVRYQWSEAIYKFLPTVPVQSVQHFRKNEYGFEFGKITIVSYDLLARSIGTFQQQLFGLVIFDESHFLKSNKTARYKAAKEIATRANHIILLSGTPALSRPMELYSQINLVNPNFMGAMDFGIRYCAGVKKNFGWDFSGSSNLHELDLLLKACCLIRRVKSDVLTQLPEKMRQVIVLDPYLIEVGTKEMMEMAKKLQRKTLTGVERQSALLQYYSESSVAKQKAICNYITDLLETREKFLVYAHHQGVLDAICDVISSKKVQYIRIDGKTNPEQRKYFVDKFQEDKEVLVAVLSITAAYAGITLTASQLVVFAELTWNPGILCQAEDRVHRIGQDRGVVIQYLIGKNTVDDYLWPKIQSKLDILNKVGLDQEFTVKDNNVSAQIAIDSDQKTIEEFLDENSSCNTNAVPNIKPYNSKSSTSINQNQTKLNSFFSITENISEVNESRSQEINTAKAENSFADLLDDDLFDVDFDDIS